MLFNKDNKGSLELQRLTGVFAASNDYASVEQYIREATQVVGGLVGSEIVQMAEDEYANDTDSGLMSAVRLPVAILATISHTRANFLSHEDRGARLRVDTHEKVPFEWMLERDEATQRDRYFKALDSLYTFLEKNQVPEWMEGEIRSTVKGSVIHSLKEFESAYPLDGSYYSYYLLQQLVVESQRFRLRRLIGAERLSRFVADNPNENEKDLMWMSQLYAAISAVVTAVKRWTLEIFPLSVARRFHPTYQGNTSSRAAQNREIESYLAGLESQLAELEGEIAQEISGRNPYEGLELLPDNDRSNKFFTAQ